MRCTITMPRRSAVTTRWTRSRSTRTLWIRGRRWWIRSTRICIWRARPRPDSRRGSYASRFGKGQPFGKREALRLRAAGLDAEFGADGGGDGVGVVAHAGLGLGLDHDAGESLGAGVADDDAAGVGKLGLGVADGGGDGGDGLERTLLADLDVDDDLGEGLEVGEELVEGLAGAVDDVEQKERGEDAVAGGTAAGEDDVAGLLAAKRGAGGKHLLEDVLVADGGAVHVDAG